MLLKARAAVIHCRAAFGEAKLCIQADAGTVSSPALALRPARLNTTLGPIQLNWRSQCKSVP